MLALVCCLFPIRAFAEVLGRSAAFSLDADQVGAFVVSDGGRLYRVVLDDRMHTVVWEDLGGTELRPSLAALTAQLAFVIGGDGNLYAKYWDGNTWQWSFQGNPGVTLSGDLAAISYNASDYVFVVGDNGRLYTNWWNGAQWQWSDLDGVDLTHHISAVTYMLNGVRQIKAYVVGGDGNLYAKYWDGNAWQWSFSGNPGVRVAFPAAAQQANFLPEAVFVVGSDGRLYAWDAEHGWMDQGGSQLTTPPVALQATAYIVGGDGTLYGKFVNDDWWSAGGCGLMPFVSAVRERDFFNDWAFVTGGNGRFYALAANLTHQWCWEWVGYDLSAYAGAP